MSLSRRSFLSAAALGAASALVGGSAKARITTTAITYAWLNVNRARYTEGKKVNGTSIDWSDRAPRLAGLCKNTVKASLYGVAECEDFMATDLVGLMGSQWKTLGCDDPQFNNNGWLYDSLKFEPVKVGSLWLSGSQSRRTATATFRHLASGRLLPVALMHLSSGDPASRDQQLDESLDELEPGRWFLSGDINASSPATPDCTSTAPRTALACRGWIGPDVGLTFHDYTATDALQLDYLALNASAREYGMALRNFANIKTYPSLSSDHNVCRVTVDF